MNMNTITDTYLAITRFYAKRISILLLFSLLAAPLLIISCRNGPPTLTKQPSLHTSVKLGLGDRLLVIAPHPDDESLAAGGLIQQALSKDVPVKVVLMTNGDGYRRAAVDLTNDMDPKAADFRKLGQIRHLESITAMSKIGLGRQNLIFLSYPDGGLDGLFSRDWDYSSLHLGVNGSTRAPYLFSYEKNAAYCGQNVVKNLSSIIEDFSPTTIIYPGTEDIHHDHWATNAFVEYTLTLLRYRSQNFTYLVHRGKDWPIPSYYAPSNNLLPPAQLTDIDVHWYKVPLSVREENKKKQAVSSYKTQLRLTGPYLEAFIRRNELFSIYPDINVGPAPRDPLFFTGRTLFSRVILDPKNDTFLTGLSGYGDLRGVSFAYDKDKVWFTIDTDQGIHKDIVYAFHLRIFRKDKVERIDARVVDGVASFPRYAKNSVNSKYVTRIRVKDNRLVMELPGKLLKDADYVMINADTYTTASLESKWIDRTGWRRIVLK